MDIHHQLHVLAAFNPQNKASVTCCTDSMIEPTFAVYLGVRRKPYSDLWIVIPVMIDSNLIIVRQPPEPFFDLIPVSSILYIIKFFIVKYLNEVVDQ
jgi:hypothetical protein